jgi:hypothetical protein
MAARAHGAQWINGNKFVPVFHGRTQEESAKKIRCDSNIPLPNRVRLNRTTRRSQIRRRRRYMPAMPSSPSID